MLTNLSYGKNISSATFSDPIGNDAAKMRAKLIYFSCIGIIVGSFDFEFRGISGVITFGSNPPIFLIGGILGIGVAYFLSLYIFYLWDDLLKWKNDITITNTNKHWKTLLEIRDGCKEVENHLRKIKQRKEYLEQKIFFSAEFLEKEDEFLKNKLASSYSTLENYIRGKKGISLKEFRQKTQPFCKKLGDDGVQYLLERIVRTDVSDNTNIYATYYYLREALKEDIFNYAEDIKIKSKKAEEIFTKSLNDFQNHNFGLSLNQIFKLLFIEVIVPVALSVTAFLLLFTDIKKILYGIYEKIYIIIT